MTFYFARTVFSENLPSIECPPQCSCKDFFVGAFCVYIWRETLLTTRSFEEKHNVLTFLSNWFLFCNFHDTGYPHDGRADNAAYRHDRRADKRRYPHDRENDIQMLNMFRN